MASFLPPPPPPEVLRDAAHRALAEDVGPGDITTAVFIPEGARAKARIFCKETCALAGLPVAEQVFIEVDRSLVLAENTIDGACLEKGAAVLLVEGSLRSILTAERAALNYLQHLSGIATVTRRFADATVGTKARILDTRKTTPGLRVLEKYAVACGGGLNHRIGLYDQFLVKDNHLAWWSGNEGGNQEGKALPKEKLAEAVARARAHALVLLEFEADTLDQVALLADLGIDRILLDNMDEETMTKAVALVAGRCELEASGNMTLARIPAVARTGVDYISVGALTHSAPAIDFSLEVLG